MSDKIQIILISILIPAGLIFWYTNTNHVTLREVFLPGVPIIHIGEIPVRVEIANTPEERESGLSERKALDKVNGLLFIFDEPGYHTMWMKDMRFPIDIIWIDEHLTVIAIDKNITPNTFPRTYRPPSPALYVLETNIHYADTFGIGVGNKVRLPAETLLDK